MTTTPRAFTPDSIARALSGLIDTYRQSRMSSAEFGDLLAQGFRFRDERGALWSPDCEGSRWFRLDNGRWTPAPPPLRLFDLDARTPAPAAVRPAASPAPPKPAASVITSIPIDHENMMRLAAILRDAKPRVAPDAFKKLHASFVAHDPAGVRWTVNLTSGQWKRSTPAGWVPAERPSQLRIGADAVKQIGALSSAPPPAQPTRAPARPKPPAAAAPMRPSTPICLKCGAASNVGAKFCGDCGATL